MESGNISDPEKMGSFSIKEQADTHGKDIKFYCLINYIQITYDKETFTPKQAV